MKIFVTGACGYIGSAVAICFSQAGHQVWGLTRSEDKADYLALNGIEPVIGQMDNPRNYMDVAQKSQVIVHCAADYSQRFLDMEKKVVEGLLVNARDTKLPRIVIYTSGCWLYGNTLGQVADESSTLDSPAFLRQRIDNERMVLSATAGPLRTFSIRPGVVYGGGRGLTSMWFNEITQKGALDVVADGNNLIAMVHVDDLARLYLNVAESGLSGEIFNAADSSRSSWRDCANAAMLAIGIKKNIQSVTLENEREKIGPFADGLVLDQRVDSEKAYRLLGWRPQHLSFIDDASRYYRSWQSYQNLIKEWAASAQGTKTRS